MVSQQSHITGVQFWRPPPQAYNAAYGGMRYDPGYYGYHGYAVRREKPGCGRDQLDPPFRGWNQV